LQAVRRQLGHATASITLDVYGHLFPDELDGLAGRLEDARADALATLARTSADQRLCLSGKVQVSERIRRCRRRDSNPHDPRFTPTGPTLRLWPIPATDLRNQ
jgi:hypothetical protein